MTTPHFEGWDDARAASLAAARRRATALLIAVTLAMVASHVFTDGEGVWGFVQAATEAAVVGGLADWFAVVAIFRHPLGLPIPHTAVLRRGKDLFGRTLGEFVARNFLDPDHLAVRLAEAQPAARLGSWLAEPDNAATAATHVSGLLAGLADAAGDEALRHGLRTLVRDRLDAMEVAPVAGAAIERMVRAGHHVPLVDGAIAGLASSLEERRELLRSVVHRESPWWVPSALDDAVADRVLEALRRFIAELGANRDHELRGELDKRLLEFAARLQSSRELIARGEQLKADFVAQPEFESWMDQLWSGLAQTLADAAADPESELRARIAEWAAATGRRLATDAEAAARLDTTLVAIATRVAAQSGDAVADLVTTTVERWDADETSLRLELLLGRDLQFIRINGTLVGGVVGLAIHTLVVFVT